MYIQFQINLSFPAAIIIEGVLIMKFMIQSNLIEMLFLQIELKIKKITEAESKPLYLICPTSLGVRLLEIMRIVLANSSLSFRLFKKPWLFLHSLYVSISVMG